MPSLLFRADVALRVETGFKHNTSCSDVLVAFPVLDLQLKGN